MWILRNKLQIARPTETVRASSVRLQGIESFQSSWRERERERDAALYRPAVQLHCSQTSIFPAAPPPAPSSLFPSPSSSSCPAF